MKTTVITNRGNILDVIEDLNFPQSIRSKVVNPHTGEGLHTDWFVKDDEVAFVLSSAKAKAKGKVHTMSPEMEEYVRQTREQRQKDKERIDMHRRSQMYSY